MELMHSFLLYLALASIVSWPEVRAQPTNVSRRSLDALLQDYAYRALSHHPRTGRVFEAGVPSNFSGIGLAALRLRTGSMRHKGFQNYKEFTIPTGVIVKPYVVRVVLVYQNLGNWSSSYYNVTNYTLLAPIVGLLAYDASNLSAKNLPELGIRASNESISIRFTNVKKVPGGSLPRCVWFNLQGTSEFSNLTMENTCSTTGQGHFSIVVESTAVTPVPSTPPAPVTPGAGPRGAKDRSRVWKIAAPVVGGSAVLVLLAFLVLWLRKYRQNKRMEEMERQAEIGEALQMTSIGESRAPMAMGTRTPPMLENEYVP